MDGRPNHRNKAVFSNSSGVVDGAYMKSKVSHAVSGNSAVHKAS